jgi:hypothetical protein
MERKLVALLSADVNGYSRLMGEDEVATMHTLTAYRTLIATLIAPGRVAVRCKWPTALAWAILLRHRGVIYYGRCYRRIRASGR